MFYCPNSLGHYNPKIPAAISYQSGTWVKDGNIWTCVFNVPTKTIDYYVYEDGVTGYNSNALATSKLSVNDNKATITNSLIKNNITLKKRLTGDAADDSNTFEFTIKVYDTNNNIVTGNFNVDNGNMTNTVIADSNGFKLYLKHDDEVIIKDITYGYTYKIEETVTDYTEYYKIQETDNNNVINAQTAGVVAQGVLTSNHTVFFTNNKESPVQTGLFLHITAFLLIILLSSMFIVFKIKKSLKNKYAQSIKTV